MLSHGGVWWLFNAWTSYMSLVHHHDGLEVSLWGLMTLLGRECEPHLGILNLKSYSIISPSPGLSWWVGGANRDTFLLLHPSLPSADYAYPVYLE